MLALDRHKNVLFDENVPKYIYTVKNFGYENRCVYYTKIIVKKMC